MTSFNPIEELNTKTLNEIQIHSTLSSLERSLSNSDRLRIEESENLPTLYYSLKVDLGSGTPHQTVHALTSDLVRFLMKYELKNQI